MTKFKVYYVMRVVLSTLALVAFGGLVLWADAYAAEVFDVLLIAMGLLSVLTNLPPFILSLRAVAKKARWEWINMVVSVMGIALGVCLALLRRGSLLLTVLLVIYALVLPVIRMLLVEKRKQQLIREFPKSCMGLFLLIITVLEAESEIFHAFGFAILVIAALYLLIKLLTMRCLFRKD